MTGQLNRRVTIKSWDYAQDNAGGSYSIEQDSYTMWAKVEARSGTMFTGQEQALWNYDYKVTLRYEASRVIKSNYTIDYDGKRMVINAVSFLEEGHRKYCIARCSTTDQDILPGGAS